jgi:hypothetical protein
MTLRIVARPSLADAFPEASPRPLLLEGSWPDGGPSLDDAIDARFQWIDAAAAYWADCLDALQDEAGMAQPSTNAAWLNALALRYYLVKLLRPVAYFSEVRRLSAADRVVLVVEWQRDQDYADLVVQLCNQADCACEIRWVDRPLPPVAAFPANRPWRRLAGRASRWLEPCAGDEAAPRVVLCGNPRLLNPVCESLVRRGCRPWWLYDRFAIGSWLQWRPRGVGQLWCNSSLGGETRLSLPKVERVECRGVDLASPLRRWLAERLEACGPRQTRILQEIDQHFARLRPQTLVLDEDATPLARAAVAVARRYGASSFVVQHGVPCCRFGFAPLAADRIFVWGQSSADQLQRWAVPPEQIEQTGAPRHDRLSTVGVSLRETLFRLVGISLREMCFRSRSERPTVKGSSPRILLLATTPPRDDRPDAVEFHLTRRSYADLLQTAISAVASIPKARLVVKLHPRAPKDPRLERLLAKQPQLRHKIVRRGPLDKWLKNVDCVLSCGSSAGVEATLAGVPVIQLLPDGSGAVLPHDAWGMQGTARNAAELRQLLDRLLRGDCRMPPAGNPRVFGDLGQSAAERIVDVVLAGTDRTSAEPPSPESISPRRSEVCPTRD